MNRRTVGMDLGDKKHQLCVLDASRHDRKKRADNEL